MQIGIMGLPGSGKTTVFNALAHARAAVGGYSAPSAEPNLAVVKVPDPRLDQLAPLFEPQKFTPAEVQYVDVAGIVRGSGKDSAGALLAHLRNVDVLLQVIRAFGSAASQGSDPTPLDDVEGLQLELILADLDVVEKRLDRLQKEAKLTRARLERRPASGSGAVHGGSGDAHRRAPAPRVATGRRGALPAGVRYC